MPLSLRGRPSWPKVRETEALHKNDKLYNNNTNVCVFIKLAQNFKRWIPIVAFSASNVPSAQANYPFNTVSKMCKVVRCSFVFNKFIEFMAAVRYQTHSRIYTFYRFMPNSVCTWNTYSIFNTLKHLNKGLTVLISWIFFLPSSSSLR